MKKKQYTKEEQQKAINQIVELLNKYELGVVTEHQIKIVPLINEEAKDEKQKN